jgi:hypothetical protein
VDLLLGLISDEDKLQDVNKMNLFEKAVVMKAMIIRVKMDTPLWKTYFRNSFLRF